MTFPKGATKRGEGWERAALRELHEEAGCKGKILMRRRPMVVSPPKAPEESCVFFWCEIDTVLKSWPAKKQRDRIWHTVGGKKKFRFTRNAGKIYKELLKLGFDQDNGKSGESISAENWLKLQLEDSATPRRRSA